MKAEFVGVCVLYVDKIYSRRLCWQEKNLILWADIFLVPGRPFCSYGRDKNGDETKKNVSDFYSLCWLFVHGWVDGDDVSIDRPQQASQSTSRKKPSRVPTRKPVTHRADARSEPSGRSWLLIGIVPGRGSL